MPVTVKPEEVPTFIREGAVSKYADIFNYQTALLRDAKRATKEAVAYTAEDGVSEENWGQIASGLRNVAKSFGVKLAIVFRKDEGRLYVKHNGEYVPLTPEQIASRKAAREANRGSGQANIAESQAAKAGK
jgi:hypothetical protein